VDRVVQILRRQRKYASFFEWPDRATKELGLVKRLVESLESAGRCDFHSPRPGPGPNVAPDCVALNGDGHPVALEVSELVSEEAIRANQRAGSAVGGVYKHWDPAELLGGISALLRVKDSKTYHGGPFWDISVLIHTDEITIRSATYVPLLTEHAFGPFRRISDAYLLFSYDGDVGGYPHVKLVIRQARWPWHRWASRIGCWVCHGGKFEADLAQLRREAGL
jgi:hypothetical protein